MINNPNFLVGVKLDISIMDEFLEKRPRIIINIFNFKKLFLYLKYIFIYLYVNLNLKNIYLSLLTHKPENLFQQYSI